MNTPLVLTYLLSENFLLFISVTLMGVGLWITFYWQMEDFSNKCNHQIKINNEGNFEERERLEKMIINLSKEVIHQSHRISTLEDKLKSHED